MKKTQLLAIAFGIPLLAVGALAQEVVSARFEGLTRIVVELRPGAGPIAKGEVIIKNAMGDTINSQDVLRLDQPENSLVISLSNKAFLYKTPGISFGATVSIKGSNVVPIQRQGGTIASVESIINGPANSRTSLWHNIGTGGGNPYRMPSIGNEASPFSLVGATVNVLLIMVDFPDFQAKDNPGGNGNTVNGEVLKTAQQYHEWLSSRGKHFMETSSYGNLAMNYHVLKNPKNPEGFYRLPRSLNPSSDYLPEGRQARQDGLATRQQCEARYPWILTQPEDWPGYAFGRGGSTNAFRSTNLGFNSVDYKPDIKAQFGHLPEDYFTMVYIGAPQNARGISYGQSFGADANIREATGYQSVVNYSFMGADAYGGFKYKHLTHELGHQLGMIDYYLSYHPQPDPYRGGGDAYANVGGFDLMGQITCVSPDIFAWMKWKNGWIKDDQVVAINAPGTYTIELTPMEIDGGSKLIFIPGERPGVVYCIEYRQRLGVNDIERLEASTDPYDPTATLFPNSTWAHGAFGIDTKPGILMYRFDANQQSIQGGLSVVDILPRDIGYNDYSQSFGTTLSNSLLGPASGIYSHTERAWGVTVSVDPDENFPLRSTNPVVVTVTKKTPTDQDRTPVLSEAQFIDQNAIQFRTDQDMRGLLHGAIMVTKADGQIVATQLNQVTSISVRATVAENNFTFDDVKNGGGTVQLVPIQANATGMNNFLVSQPVSIGPARAINEIRLRNLGFENNTTISAVQTTSVQLSDVATNYSIKKADGTIVPSEQISASYNSSTKRLTLKIDPSQFPDAASSKGATLTISLPSNFTARGPAAAAIAKFYHNVVAVGMAAQPIKAM